VSPQSTIATAGFVDAHTHLRSTSYADHGITGKSFEEALLRMSAMTTVPIEDDVFVACADLLAHGVTTVQVIFHTFGDPDDYRAALDATIQGIERSGIRALVVLGTTDQAEFLPAGAKDPGLPGFCRVTRRLSETEFGDVVAHATREYPGITFGVGPVGPQWCSDSLLGTIGDIATEGYRVHSHFLESAAQRTWAPGDVLSRMEIHGLLGPRTSLAHAVWCSDRELQILSDFGVQLVTCPHSNRLLQAGRAPVDDWLRWGITVGVGLDSADPAARPLDVAQLALPPAEAERALTEGGLACTGFSNVDDRVVWSDREAGIVESVEIDGTTLVSHGQFREQSALRLARERIVETMNRDAANRKSRHSSIDAMIHTYRRDLTASDA
jgi:cytosine/adenosine deaminase-related metal-dependent hydrolase